MQMVFTNEQFLEVAIEKLDWGGLEPPTTEFRSDTKADWVISPIYILRIYVRLLLMVTNFLW